MNPGDTKTITLLPEQAFGQHLEALVLTVDQSVLPEDCPREIGVMLKNKQPDGRLVDVRITDINGEQVTLDANHPLAGNKLIIDLELVEILN
jgi:FKBP-type peptidyl-prolyl cis-trans isomerase 2